MTSDQGKKPLLRRVVRRPRRLHVVLAVTVGGLVLASTVAANAAPRPHATMTGRAYGLTATLGLLGNAPSTLLGPLPDTGAISTTESTTTAPACISVPAGLITVHALCDSVATHAFTSRVAANSTLADLSITVPGLPVIALRGVKAWSTISCGSTHGTTTIAYLKIGGKNVISRKTTFSNGTTIAVGPVKIVIDETTRTGPPSRSRSVNAVHISADVPNVADLDVIVSSASAGVTDCS
jgi:hypothetical protein